MCKEHIPSFSGLLDVFGGTSIVSLYFMRRGKNVIYNDIMISNGVVANVFLNCTPDDIPDDVEIRSIFEVRDDMKYDDAIARNFPGIYFTEVENRQLDIAIQNLLYRGGTNDGKNSVLKYLLMQSAMIKRPFNLFHRKNLYMRADTVVGKRPRQQKRYWDKAFQDYMMAFRNDLTKFMLASPQKRNPVTILRRSYDNIPDDILETQSIDTVYIDPPYFKKDCPNRDYIDYYHFLEGMLDYENWQDKIDDATKHKRFTKRAMSPYTIRSAKDMFATLIKKYASYNILISYRSDGYPSIEDIEVMMRAVKKNVVKKEITYRYALAKKDAVEVLLLGFA
jgi:adenine-specific DNA methylase